MEEDASGPTPPLDERPPLKVGLAVAERFMKISPPRETYMYHIGLQGLLDLWEAAGEARLLDFYLDRYGRVPRFDWALYTLTREERWLEGARELGEQFLADPRRDREGALLDPRGRYTVDVLSGQFTTPIIFGHVLGDDRYFDEAARLLEINQGYLEDPQTGLWYSRWGSALHPSRPNPGLWARGNGWLANAWSRVMHLWDASHCAYGQTLTIWKYFCASIAAHQTDSGMFRQLLNREDCFEETSATGLFCSAFANGVRFGTLPDHFGASAWRAFSGIRAVVESDGGVHNVSTYAGGYNFERQYYSCARYCDPHGDGTVMSACAALHLLQEEMPNLKRPAPTQSPRIVTVAEPGLLTADPPVRREAVDIAPPVLRRALELESLPTHDPFSATIHGLLDWHEFSTDTEALDQARVLQDCDRAGLSVAARYCVAARTSLATGEECPGLKEFVDEELRRSPRDRCGLLLDEYGGYDVSALYVWLPLLAETARLTGDEAYLDEACTQYLGYRGWLECPLTRLWYSAFGRGRHPRRRTPGLWGLGNGYSLAGAIGLLERLPPTHKRYVDVILAVRGHVSALHEYLPVSAGWSQLLDDPDSFHCVGVTALLTYGCAKAIYRGWVEPEYYAVVAGGIRHLGQMVDEQGVYGSASLPFGGLDAPEDYEDHRVENDPARLGHILSACAWAGRCQDSGIDYDAQDKRLGAR